MQVLLQIEKSKLQLQIRQQLKQQSNLHPFYRSIILYTIKYKKVLVRCFCCYMQYIFTSFLDILFHPALNQQL